MDEGAEPGVSVGHISVEVSNVAEARRFYEPVLKSIGFKLILEEKDAVGLSNGSFAMFFGKPESPRVKRKAPNEGEFVIADHIALLVPDRRTVDQVASLLKKAGFSPLFAPEEHPEFTPSYYSASFSDPDNNVIEFYTTENRRT